MGGLEFNFVSESSLSFVTTGPGVGGKLEDGLCEGCAPADGVDEGGGGAGDDGWLLLLGLEFDMRICYKVLRGTNLPNYRYEYTENCLNCKKEC